MSHRDRRAVTRTLELLMASWGERRDPVKTDDDLTVEAALWDLLGEQGVADALREARDTGVPQPGAPRVVLS